MEVLSKLADFYKTSVDYLLFRTDEVSPYPKRHKRKYVAVKSAKKHSNVDESFDTNNAD